MLSKTCHLSRIRSVRYGKKFLTTLYTLSLSLSNHFFGLQIDCLQWKDVSYVMASLLEYLLIFISMAKMEVILNIVSST
jgi:hypothetical protein